MAVLYPRGGKTTPHAHSAGLGALPEHAAREVLRGGHAGAPADHGDATAGHAVLGAGLGEAARRLGGPCGARHLSRMNDATAQRAHPPETTEGWYVLHQVFS